MTVADVVFDEDDIGICVRDKKNRVLSQNAICAEICGKYESRVCEGCVSHSTGLNSKFSYLPGSRFNANGVDKLFIFQKTTNLTLLTRLNQEVSEVKEWVDEGNLTAKEKQIIELLSKGFSNQQIMVRLAIKRSTLKTHLNHIYQKIPQIRDVRSLAK